jgi:hypothetical protein
MIKVLWSNNIKLPTKSVKAKELRFHTPFLDKTYISADTSVGYSKHDLVNNYDGLHSRFFVFVILGFGVSLAINWNSDGKYAN